MNVIDKIKQDNDGKWPWRYNVSTEEILQALKRVNETYGEDKNCKQVKQECSCCGHRFSLMYRADGTYTYLDEPCECEAEFFPLGPSLSEWLEQIRK